MKLCLTPYALSPDARATLEALLGPSVPVIVERRQTERRRDERRRDEGSASDNADRRRTPGSAGRRIAERRATLVPVPADVPAALAAAGVQVLARVPPTAAELQDRGAVRLVVAFQKGERRRSFEAIYKCYYDLVYGYVHLLVHDSHEAEDAVQETFMRVLRALHRYEHRGLPFRAWLLRIARNVAFNRLSRAGRAVACAPDRLPEIAVRDQALARIEETTALGSGELAACVDRLPLAQRQVLVLRCVLDLSTSEASVVLDRSPEAVRQLQHRALASLRRRLDDHAPSRRILASPPEPRPGARRARAALTGV